MRTFNTAGPCVESEHYMLPPERRFGRIDRLVDEKKFFVLRAGRQTGKTTVAQSLAARLTASGTYTAIWIDLQTAREQPDPTLAFRTLLGALDEAFARDFPSVSRPSADAREELLRDPGRAILRYLHEVAAACPRPLVIFFDEADGLVGQAMVSFLTQLRAGYIERHTTPFAHSIVLIGQREIRDYALSSEERRAVAWLGTTSPFNVTAETATLPLFTADEVKELLEQHTHETGQVFETEAAELIFTLSQGHPWLVNALAALCVERLVVDRSQPITARHVDVARERMILERRTHIDSLIARLREPRVRRIIEPMLIGATTTSDVLDDDFAYVLGLGLLATRQGRFEIANPIYREVLPRALTYIQQMQIPHQPAKFVLPNGELDMPKLMLAWQDFWREDGHLAADGFEYKEAGPHLMLMAFLQRIVNGGGRIDREYGLGRGSLDLIVHWTIAGQAQPSRHLIEVKLRRDENTESRAIAQVVGYLDTAQLDEGWLVLFDLRKTVSWGEKVVTKVVAQDGKTVHVIGC